MATVSNLNPDLLTNEEAAALLGIKPNTLEIWELSSSLVYGGK